MHFKIIQKDHIFTQATPLQIQYLHQIQIFPHCTLKSPKKCDLKKLHYLPERLKSTPLKKKFEPSCPALKNATLKIKSGKKNTSNIKISVIVQTWVYSVINITLRYLHIRNPKRKLNSNKLVSGTKKNYSVVIGLQAQSNYLILQELSQVGACDLQRWRTQKYEMLGDFIFFSDPILTDYK